MCPIIERQLSFFDEPDRNPNNKEQITSIDPDQKVKKNEWHLYVDGAARCNPGPAGAGIFIVKNDVPVLKKGFFLGPKTNNQAEYIAFLVGMYHLKSMLVEHDDNQLFCYSDSLLMVRQLNGHYRVLDATLKQLFSLAKKYTTSLSITIKHIPREKNSEADEAANWGIDQKNSLPKPFVSILSSAQ